MLCRSKIYPIASVCLAGTVLGAGAFAQPRERGEIAKDLEQVMAEVRASTSEALRLAAVSMAAGADQMATGSRSMEEGADEMEDYARKLRDPAFRRAEVERINSEEGYYRHNGERRPVTEQDLIDSIPELESGAVELREGAVEMREGAEAMRRAAGEMSEEAEG